jgi:hypothetical protein
MTTNKRTAVKAHRRTAKPAVDPEVFIRAAEIIVNDGLGWGRGCCSALSKVLDPVKVPLDSSHHHYFEALLRPIDSWKAWWYEESVHDAPEDMASCDQARTLGLLLCAELAREGFIPPGFEPEKGAEQ